MAYSDKLYTGDGVTTDWTVTFDYLDQSHIRVSVDKILTTAVGALYKFEWINSTTVRVRTVITDLPVPSGLEIRIFRVTPIAAPAVVFGSGASLSSTNLNKNSEYLTFALQEATDENEQLSKYHLGAFAVAPTTDNEGDTLLAGATYLNTVDDSIYYWSGTAWVIGESVTVATAQADAAAASASAASGSASAASSSASAASSSAGAASASAGAASASATAASNSAAAALASQNAASSSASAASGSAAAALASQNAASASEIAAGASETAAAASAGAASASASAASGSAGAASTSASNASASEIAAAASEAAAAASYDAFDDRYLGAKASDPALDNDGNALLTGALYFNTTASEMRVYDGAAWVAAYASLGSALLATNNLSDVANAATARTNLGVGTGDSPSFAGLTVDTSTLYVDSVNNRVGIGTSSPATELQVGGGNDGSDHYVTLGKPFANESGLRWLRSSTVDCRIYVDNNENMRFTLDETNILSSNFFRWDANGSELMRLTDAGFLGIGKTTPTTALDVNGTVTATAYLGDGSGLTGIAAGAGGGGSDEIFWENGQTVTTNYTITNGKNAMSAGPITINSGVTVTVGAGESWTVV